MKKLEIAGITLAASLVVALAGCGTGGTDQGSGDGTGTITIAGQSKDKDALDAIVALMEEAHPEIEVILNLAPLEEYKQQIRTQLFAGTAPDVIMTWPGVGNSASVIPLAEEGYLADLSDQAWAADVPEGIRNVTSFDGGIYSKTTGVAAIGAIYNLDALDALNGGAIPETFTEVLEFCAEATAAGKTAYALGLGDAWITALPEYALNATLVYTDPEFDAKMAKGETTFAGGGFEESMDKYVEMKDAGCFGESPLSLTYEASLAEVASGAAIGTVQVNAALPPMKDNNPDATYLFTSLPATDDPEETYMAVASSTGYSVNAKAKNLAAAKVFIDFLATPEAAQAFADAMGVLPTNPTADAEIDPAIQSILDFTAAGKTGPFADQLWPDPKLQEINNASIEEIFLGTKTVKEMVDAMDKAYSEIEK